jgi:predicted phosphodiesterase
VKTAVIFDVHGNLAALEAVLAAAEQGGFEQLVCGGDVCLFGPQPAEVADRLRGFGPKARFVQGNTDRYLWHRQRPKHVEWQPDLLDWYREALGPERLAWLGSMQHDQVLPRHDAIVVHASPRSDEDVIMPDTPVFDVARKLGGVHEHSVLFGHVHVQFRRTIEPWEIVNPGSVGLPFDGIPDAGWAMLEDGVVTLHRTPYDRDATIAALEASDIPWRESTLRRLRESKS